MEGTIVNLFGNMSAMIACQMMLRFVISNEGVALQVLDRFCCLGSIIDIDKQKQTITF